MKTLFSLRGGFSHAGGFVLSFVSLLVGPLIAQDAFPAMTKFGPTKHARVGELERHVYLSELTLPADGLWELSETREPADVRELYLTPEKPARVGQLGKRMRAAIVESGIQNGRWQVQMGYEACRWYAQQHEGLGPQSIADLGKGELANAYIADAWEKPRYQMAEIGAVIEEAELKGPFVHLVPNARFVFEPVAADETRREEGTRRGGVRGDRRNVRREVAKKDRKILAFELRPIIDDGKHWVLYTDGVTERVAIDREMVSRAGVTITPLLSEREGSDAAENATVPYRLVMVSGTAFSGTINLQLENLLNGAKRTIRWDISRADDVPHETLHDGVMESRAFAWRPYAAVSSGGVLSMWEYGLNGRNIDARRSRQLSMFSILGGRAAIEETLQLQALDAWEEDEEEKEASQPEMVAINELAGVEVESHPFEEMLDGAEGGELRLANFVPHDRFFLYIGKPAKVPAFLDKGAPFLSGVGSAVTGNSLRYGLEERYLAKLGLTRKWLDQVLSAGVLKEFAVFTPDLFFIDGTDVTVVATLEQPAMMRPLLALLGAMGKSTGEVTELPTASGEPAYLAMRGDLLWISTHADELQSSLDLHGESEAESLGRSAEFRYMLTQLPVQGSTRMYAYLSDPFVRRLVGPEVKIGQLRRLRAKAEMEVRTAEAMLAALEGYTPGTPEASSVERIMGEDWWGEEGAREALAVQPSGLVRSSRYGTLRDTKTLRELELEKATRQEANAYRAYRENYSRYWRQFFDPIGIRLNDAGPGELELETFILPLVDNSIYNGLRQFVMAREDQQPLLTPVVEPEPVLSFSVNLKEQAWTQFAGMFRDLFTLYAGVNPAMLDDFGPGLHFAVFDADPILAMGSGDIFGAFGGDMLRGGSGEMLMVPVIASMLTRPANLMIETQDPERTRQFLRQLAITGVYRQRSDEVDITVHQEGDADRWVWTLDFFGFVKLRYGVEVQGKFLVIRNIPWSADDRIVSLQPTALNGALLQVNPGACVEQLPSLYAAAADSSRHATMTGLAQLYPFLVGGERSVGAAIQTHQQLFGFAPQPLMGDAWQWKQGRLVSEQFGEPSRQRQAKFDPQRPFGSMQAVDTLQLQMQFEDDGLRSSLRWRLR